MPGLDESLVQITRLDGVLAAAVVDYGTGSALRSAIAEDSANGTQLPTYAEDGAESARLTRAWLAHADLDSSLENILVTTDTQYQLVRVLQRGGLEWLLLFVALDRERTNLALALRQIDRCAQGLVA